MITIMVWQSDVDLVINRLSADKHKLKDLSYFYQTVDLIEDQRSPNGTQHEKLTLCALKAWESRCRNGREQTDGHYVERATDTAATADHDREEDPEYRPFSNSRTVIKPKHMGQIHKHGE